MMLLQNIDVINLMRRLKNNRTLFDRYDEVIHNHLKESIVEMVNDNETNGSVYYLPHHPIIKEDRATTILRVVFHASSHEKDSCSLNECLLIGPNLNPDLFSILIKSRQYPVALKADIKTAFLQISIDRNDRDFSEISLDRWQDNVAKRDQNKNTQDDKSPVCSVIKPLSPGSYYTHHLKQHEEENPEVLQTIRECHYVNDFISGADNWDTAA